jgi:hypothetical protein
MKQTRSRSQRKTNSTRAKRNSSQMRLVNGIPFIGTGAGSTYGFPDKMMSKVRYHDTEPLTVSGGSLQKYVYRLNSTFDPDLTGVGHQPLFRDTYAAIYDHYSVVSAKALIKFINTSSVAFHIGCLIDDDNTTSTTLDTLCEQSHGQHKVVPPVTGSLSTHTFNVTWDCKKILGIDPFASETYKTAVGSNPAEESDLTVWALSIDASANTVYFDIEIEYTVLWTELSTPVQS